MIASGMPSRSEGSTKISAASSQSATGQPGLGDRVLEFRALLAVAGPDQVQPPAAGFGGQLPQRRHLIKVTFHAGESGGGESHDGRLREVQFRPQPGAHRLIARGEE
jgi:hypothetical protein